MSAVERSVVRAALAVGALFCVCVSGARGQEVATVAGGGSEEGLLATEVLLHWPAAAAIDAGGALYVVEQGVFSTDEGAVDLRPRVRRIAPDGRVTLVAGSGEFGPSGDNGPAVEARFNEPAGIAVDRDGSIYVADERLDRVRRVTPDGFIELYVGGAVRDDGVGDDGEALDAMLDGPRGLALDAEGNLYIADSRQHRIRRVDVNGIITTVAGTGEAGFSGDGGPAAAARLNQPTHLAFDASGNLIVTDLGNNRVRRVAPDGTITTVAGNGERAAGGEGTKAVATSLLFPAGIAGDRSGALFIAEQGANRIRRVAPDGTIATVAGQSATRPFGGDGGAAARASLSVPGAVLVDGSGALLIVDTGHNRIRRVAADGTITTFAGGVGRSGTPATEAVLADPRGGVRDAQGNTYIADQRHFRILKVDAAGVLTVLAGVGAPGYSGDGGPASQAAIGGHVDGLAVDGLGNLYVPDLDNQRVRRIAPDGTITTVAGNGEAGYSGDGGPAIDAALSERGFWNVATDAAGNLFIADGGNHRVRRVDARTRVIATVAGSGSDTYGGDGGMATEAGIPGPDGLFVDATGNLYIGDTDDFRIRRVAADGTITTIAGTGDPGFEGDGGPARDALIGSPENLALDTAGNLYFTDAENDRIRRVAADGTIATIAGSDTGFAGDGGPASDARFNYPADLYRDPTTGDLLIADEGNHRIRIITGLPR
jgi:sugar lactone lactonase YvrE